MADEDIDPALLEGIQAAVKSRQDTDNRPEGYSRRSPRRRSRTRSHSRRRHRGRSRSHSKSRRRSRRSRSPRRSRGSSRRDGGRSHSRSRERPPKKKRKSKSRSRSAPPKEERERSTSAERAERAKQRELMELTRDHRTVFVGQLAQKVREKDLERFFTKTGKVESVLLIRDKFTNRSKGFAYVELSNLEDVPKVLPLNGLVPEFQAFPIMIKASEAEKNFAAKKDSVMNANAATSMPLTVDVSGADLAGAFAGGAGMSASALSAASRIYCGNLHTNITEDDLRIVFQSFGEVLSVTINRDEMGRSKGFSFIQFSSPQEANFALSKGNGLELAGNYLRLGPVNENAVGGGSRSIGGAGGSGADNGATGGRWKLEDDEGTGLSMNVQSRSALMAKLAGSDANLFHTFMEGSIGTVGGSSAATDFTTNSMAASAAQRAEQAAALMSSTEIEGSESFCFVVKNMFDVYQEQKSGNSEWSAEIQQDVEEECGQYGPVLHTYVEKEKQGGLVYVLFDNVGSAVSAAKKLHGRWFNKRQISVRYLSSQEYVGMFPEARSAVQTARANSSQ